MPRLPGGGTSYNSAGRYGNNNNNNGLPSWARNSGSFGSSNRSGANASGGGGGPELRVTGVDAQIAANAARHHTEDYDACQLDDPQALGSLVVRRGWSFDLVLTLSRPLRRGQDDLRLVFQAGKEPSVAKGTEVSMVLSDAERPGQWGAKTLKTEGSRVWVTVFTPANAAVAPWNLSLDVLQPSNRRDVVGDRFGLGRPIYVLFNPWCKEDQVYMEDTRLLGEYVLNENGRIWTGSQHQTTSKPWFYGQFEPKVLETCMELLNHDLNWQARGDAVAVTRAVSAAINSQDDGGVLVGSWSGDYRGGTAPAAWTGSAKILQQYWDSGRPVCFAQCWVYAGVATTVSRCLGLPARPVTNYMSAHDTDASLSIDTVWTRDGRLDESRSDSTWNFHVWNEAWMARADLPQGYGGWQAFDATPQECSDGVYRCGPCSVAAIRQGEVTLPNDAGFVFSEVNGDVFHWEADDAGTLKFEGRERNSVGRKVSTKAAFSHAREDITDQYKPREGTDEERACVLRANKLAGNRPDLYFHQDEDVSFQLEQDGEGSWVGDDFRVTVKISSGSGQRRSVSGAITLATLHHTGVPARRLGTIRFKKDFSKRAVHRVDVVVRARDYARGLAEGGVVGVAAWARVTPTNQTWRARDAFRLRKPHLNVEGPEEGVAGQPLHYDVHFVNPLWEPLTSCFLTVDGVVGAQTLPMDAVEPKAEFRARVPVTPRRAGHKELVLCFSCQQLQDVNAATPLFVRPRAI